MGAMTTLAVLLEKYEGEVVSRLPEDSSLSLMVAFVSCALLTPLVFAEGTTANANEL
jgi:hypothetical protein